MKKFLASAALAVTLSVGGYIAYGQLTTPDPYALGVKCGKIAAQEIADHVESSTKVDECMEEARKRLGLPEDNDSGELAKPETIPDALNKLYEEYPQAEPFVKGYFEEAFKGLGDAFENGISE